MVLFIYLFIYLFTHIQSTTCCCVIDVVHSKATVNSGGRRKKVAHTESYYTHKLHICGQGYNSNYSVHKYFISSFNVVLVL